MTERGHALIVLALLSAISLHPTLVLAGKVTGSFVAGFDSYTEKYSVVEEDTLDQLKEFRARLNLGYLQGTYLKDYINVEGQALFGEESVEMSGRLNMLQRSGAHRFALNTDLSFRRYNDNTSYAFANDFVRAESRAYLQRDVTPELSVRLANRMEIIDFKRRTQFDYDYLKNTVQMSSTLERGFYASYRAAVGFTQKVVPDTTEIAYKAYTGSLEYRRTFGLHKQVFATVAGERRLYAHAPVKSPFWSFHSDANIQPFARGNFGITVINTLESYSYDENTGVFVDYVENRTSTQVSYYRSLDLSVGIGPTAGFLSSDSSEDEYTEFGARVSLDYSSGRVWLSASYEPGQRDYNVDSNDSIFSDFVYHRILLFATARVWRNTNVNIFVNHEPQRHARDDDDSTATLLSADVSYSF